MKLTPTQRALLHLHITGELPGRIHVATYRAAMVWAEIAETRKVALYSNRNVWRLSSAGREIMAKIPGFAAVEWLEANGYALRPYQTGYVQVSYSYEDVHATRAYINLPAGSVSVYGNGIASQATRQLDYEYLLAWAVDRAKPPAPDEPETIP